MRNHAPEIAAMDLFVVPTVGFDRLHAFVVIRLDRRELVWINITANPTAEWVARQITKAFPWDEAPGYMIRDRDRIYGTIVARRLRAMRIRDGPAAPASPWQNGFAERLIGSIRRECLDHIVVFCAEPCDPTLAITTTSERTGHWTTMRRSLAGPTVRQDQIDAHPRRTPSPLCSGLGFRYTQAIWCSGTASAISATSGTRPSRISRWPMSASRTTSCSRDSWRSSRSLAICRGAAECATSARG